MPIRKYNRPEEEEEEKTPSPVGPAPVAPSAPTLNQPQNPVAFTDFAPSDAALPETQTERQPVGTSSVESDQKKKETSGGHLSGGTVTGSSSTDVSTVAQNGLPSSAADHVGGLVGPSSAQVSVNNQTPQPTVTTGRGTNEQGLLDRKTPPPPPPPLRAGRPQTGPTDSPHQRLATLSQLNAPTSTPHSTLEDRLSRLQSIAENVKQMIKAKIGTENPLEIESRTDVKRFVKVAQTRQGEKLVINTDVYIPGRWFRRRQWRPLDQNEEDEFFLKSAGTEISKK